MHHGREKFILGLAIEDRGVLKVLIVRNRYVRPDGRIFAQVERVLGHARASPCTLLRADASAFATAPDSQPFHLRSKFDDIWVLSLLFLKLLRA